MFVRRVGQGDDVYYYNCWRLKLEGETESICVCTKERKGVSAELLKVMRHEEFDQLISYYHLLKYAPK